MDRYSIISSNQPNLAAVEKLRKEFALLDGRAKEKFDPWVYVVPIHLALTVIVALGATAWSKDVFTGVVFLLGYIYIPGMFVTAFLASVSFSLFEKSLERYWLKRRLESTWYARHAYLKAELRRIDTEKEEFEREYFASSFDLLARLRIQKEGISQELSSINHFFSRKRKWYDNYRTYEARLIEIKEQSETTFKTIDGHQLETPEMPAHLGLSFNALKVTAKRDENLARSILDHLEWMKEWTLPPTPGSSNRTPTRSIESSPRTQSRNNEGGQQRTVIEEHNGHFKDQKLQIIEQELPPPPPPPLKRIEHLSVAKISTERYLEMAKAKMSIGDIGEKLVLDFEKQRVAQETGTTANEVRRVSDENDSLGYDILSSFEGEPVYIEVKTTRGKFDADFFLTTNELKTMRDKAEKYWLYRVYELSADSGTAKLSVFRGQTTVEDVFILEPTAYVFRRRRAER